MPFCIDYFATLGKPDGPLKLKIPDISTNFDYETDPAKNWNDAITDIIVVFKDKGETVPSEEWSLLETSVSGAATHCNIGDDSRPVIHIAYQRRCYSKRKDHITHVTIIQKGEEVPSGYELLVNTVSGEHIADINRGGSVSTMIAVKRASVSDEAILNGAEMLMDVCFVNKSLGEETPEGYFLLDKNLNKGATGDKIFIGYFLQAPVGLCNLQYESLTLDRFPKVDNSSVSLPVKELPMFVFPHELKVRYCSHRDYPLPDFFTFVFTDVNGCNQYVACLRFYEIVPFMDFLPIIKAVYGEEVDFAMSSDMNLVCPKVICLLSQYPFYKAMGRYLKQLYSISLSPSAVPLEHFIATIISKLPIPTEGGRSLNIYLDAALISNSSRPMPVLNFQLPPLKSFSFVDLDFAAPMRCLSLENLFAILALMLQESKIIFMCSSNALLTEAMEIFRSIIFPLQWNSCFVTRLPEALHGLLQAPGGFMIGLHIEKVDYKSNYLCEVKHLDKQHAIRISQDPHNSSWAQSLQNGTFLVDLSDNSLHIYTNGNIELLPSSKVSNLVKMLPSSPLKRLQSKLQLIASKFQLCPQTKGLEQFDSAFEIKSFDLDFNIYGNKFPTQEVREAFLMFMAEILGDVSAYVNPPSLEYASNTFRTFKEEFMVQEYLFDADKQMKTILEKLTETQMFATYIQQRKEKFCHHVDFFDEYCGLMKHFSLPTLSDLRFHKNKFDDLPNLYSEWTDHGVGMSEMLRRMKILSSTFNVDKTQALKFNFKESKSLPLIADRIEFSFEDAEELSKLPVEEFYLGPIVFPGPCSLAEPTKFKYSTWPILDSDLLSSTKISKGMSFYCKYREEVSNKDMKYVFSLVRDATERNSYTFIPKLIRSIKLDAPIESSAALSMVMDAYINSILFCSFRCHSGVNSVGTILQIFGLLTQFEKMGWLQHLDEYCWRSILFALNSIKSFGRFSHDATCVVDESMQSLGFFRNVITQYYQLKNLNAGSFSTPPSFVSHLDPYYHLEVLGVCWYSQRIKYWENVPADDVANESLGIVLKRTNSPAIGHTPPVSTPSTPNASRKTGSLGTPKKEGWAIFSNARRSSVTPAKTRRRSFQATTNSMELADKLNLVRKGGVFSILRPNNRLSFCIPQLITEDKCFSAIIVNFDMNSEEALKGSIEKLRKLYDNKEYLLSEQIAKLSKNKVVIRTLAVTSDDPDDGQNSEHYVKISTNESSDSSFKVVVPFISSKDLLQTEQQSNCEEFVVEYIPANNTVVSFVLSLKDSDDLKLVGSAEVSLSYLKSPGISKWLPVYHQNILQREVFVVINVVEEHGATNQKPDTVDKPAMNEKLSWTSRLSFGLLKNKKKSLEWSASLPPDSSENSALHTPVKESVPHSTLSRQTSLNEAEAIEIENVFIESIGEMSKSFEELLAKTNRCLGIYSATPCECGKIPLDEEVMAYWAGFNKMDSKSCEDDITTAHQIICHRCGKAVQPILHCNVYELVDNEVKALWSTSAPYVSPYGLRYHMESLILRHGVDIVRSDWLQSNYPLVFWNLLWYSTRLATPCGLICPKEINEDLLTMLSFKYTVMIGWRESVLMSKVKIFLAGNLNGKFELKSVFPNSTEADLGTATEMMASLDGTFDSIKNAIMVLSTLKSLTDNFGDSSPRNIYLTLISLIYYFKNSPLLEISREMPHALCKGVLFDRVYPEAVSNSFTEEDLSKLELSIKDFLDASSSKSCVAFRIGFGFLF